MMTLNVLIPLCLSGLLVVNGFLEDTDQATETTIDAAYTTDEHVVLFANNKALYIDKTTKQEVNLTSAIILKKPPKMRLQAAWYSKDQVLYYGDKNGFYTLLHNNSVNRKLRYGPARELIRHGGPDAVGRRKNINYFFKGCQVIVRHRWSRWENVGSLTALGLPCTPDAAWSEGQDMVLLKGDQIWRWTQDSNILGPCPFSSKYSISSWSLTVNPDVTLPQCPQGWELSCETRTCFRLFSNHETFARARAACQTFTDGDLATVRTQGTFELLSGLVSHKIDNYWIGLNDIREENTFDWLDETTQANLTFWEANQPDSFDIISQNCVYVWGRHPNGQNRWDDVNCHSSLAYICERPSH